MTKVEVDLDDLNEVLNYSGLEYDERLEVHKAAKRLNRIVRKAYKEKRIKEVSEETKKTIN